MHSFGGLSIYPSAQCSGNYSLVGTKVGPDACGLTSRVMAA